MKPNRFVGPLMIALVTAGVVEWSFGRETHQQSSLVGNVLMPQYFPAGALAIDKKMDRFKAEWYSQELAVLGEPSVWKASRERSALEVYRFLWLRSFHAPICIRLTIENDGTGSLISKEGSVHGGTEFGKLTHAQKTVISKEQTKAFLDRVRAVEFWNLRSPSNDLGGADGSSWIIEGGRHGLYKVVDVWSAPVGDPVHSLGAMLTFDLAHTKVPPALIY
jgi:hypothetical protein